MSVEQLRHQLLETAKDIKLNIASVLTQEGSPDLTQPQIGGIALASAYASKNKTVIEAILSEVKPYLTQAAINAAQSAATIMAMNNIYYRFVHLVKDAEFSSLPAKLRMNVLANPGIDKVDFELSCLAVSAINGCGLCIESHTHQLIKDGISKKSIQSSIRIAAVVNAVAMGIEIAAL